MEQDEACPSGRDPSPASEPSSTTDTDYSWSVPLSIDTSQQSLLSHVDTPVAGDSSVPRKIIVSELRSIQFLAKLERPFLVGVYNQLPAYLLHFSFSFQDTLLGSNSRVRQAIIKIIFYDAPANADTDDSDDESYPPCIPKIYPELFEGPVSTADREVSTEMSLSGTGISPVSPAGKRSDKKSWKEEGCVVVQGNTVGSPEHKVIWTVSENPVTKGGIPKKMKLPLILIPQNGRRFSAKLTLQASYGIWKGALANMLPVIGKDEKPIYFDPAALELMAKQKYRSRFDGAIVAEEADLTTRDIREFFSISPEEPPRNGT